MPSDLTNIRLNATDRGKPAYASATRAPQTAQILASDSRRAMPPVTDPMLAMTLEARILNPKRRPGVSGRKTELELHGMGGTPRKASAKHAFNKKAIERNQPRLGYIPPETERTYEQELERINMLQDILRISQQPATLASTANPAYTDEWERRLFSS